MQPGGAALASTVRAYAGDTLSLLAKSRIGMSGLALALAGFLGLFSVVTLQLQQGICLLYTSPSPRDGLLSRMPSSA